MKSSRHFLKLFILGVFMVALHASATHYRAGDISYEYIAPLTYKVTVRTITEDNLADRDSVRIRWGDGSSDEILMRSNGPIINGYHNGEPAGFGFKRNLYIGTHTYAAAPPSPRNYYIISFNDPSRVGNVINMNNGNSDDVPFYAEDTLFFDSNLTVNSSPVFIKDPFDYAQINQLFVHNQNPLDPDGDSLSFELVKPLMAPGVPAPNWRTPQDVPVPNDLGNQFSVDRFTGNITWDVPKLIGLYNIGILVKEYRAGVLIGTVHRDFHIIIDNNHNTTGIDQQKLNDGLFVKLLPNPNSGNFKLEMDDNKTYDVTISNLISEIIMTAKVQKEHNFMMNDAPTGIYLVTISNDSNVTTLKFSLNK